MEMITTMKINYVQGDLLKSDAEALVNTVNCVGVMGKGIALKFKKQYPNMFNSYRSVCYNKKLIPGHLHYFKEKNKIIINFPTKNNWRNPSKIEYVKDGLISLIKLIKNLNLKSIAIPMLGCGNGGLDWKEVNTLIINTLTPSLRDTDLTVYIYANKTMI